MHNTQLHYFAMQYTTHYAMRYAVRSAMRYAVRFAMHCAMQYSTQPNPSQCNALYLSAMLHIYILCYVDC